LAATVLIPAAPAQAVTCNVSVASDAQISAQNTFSTLAPGSTVCIAPGNYAGQLAIAGTRGTASQPIVFIVGPSTGIATFTSGVLLRNVSYVKVSGLTVSLNPNTSQYGAVILDTGTNHSSISGFVVQNSYVGISLGSYNHPITHNFIYPPQVYDLATDLSDDMGI